MATTTTKPLGMTATAVYAAFSGLIYLSMGLLFLFASQASTSGILFTACGLMFCVLGMFMLAYVYGLWSLQEWGAPSRSGYQVFQ